MLYHVVGGGLVPTEQVEIHRDRTILGTFITDCEEGGVVIGPEYLLAQPREVLPPRKSLVGVAPNGLEHDILDSLLTRGHRHHGLPPFTPTAAVGYQS